MEKSALKGVRFRGVTLAVGVLCLCTSLIVGETTVPTVASAASPSQPSCPIALNSGQPRFVVLLADGINTSTPGDSYNPLDERYCFAVDSPTGGNKGGLGVPGATHNLGPNGKATPGPLKSILNDYFTTYWPQTQDQYLTNVIGRVGAVIIPFSYAGASFSGSQLVVHKADSILPGALLPNQAADVMQAEVHAIHGHWPKATIEIIGHSEGGWVAERWWLNHGAGNPQGVQNVFSLDSPINGVRNAFVCGAAVASAICTFLAGVTTALGGYYTSAWLDQTNLDKKIVSVDNGQRPQYFAIGTRSDPVYVFGDKPVSDPLTSQIVLSETCSGINTCNPAAMDINSSCSAADVPLSGPNGILPGHGMVENCNSNIQYEVCFLLGQPNNCKLPFGGTTTSPKLTSATSCGENQLSPAVNSFVSKTTQYTSSEYKIVSIKTAGSHPTWASFGLVATAKGQNVFQDSKGVASCDHGWKVFALGGLWVGCHEVPTSLHAALGVSCPPPATKAPTPGYGTPQDAVAGLFAGLTSNNLTAACMYAPPSDRASCAAAYGGFTFSGVLHINGVIKDGTRALVEVTGTFCDSTFGCTSNSDPNIGLPDTNTSFSTAYSAAVNSGAFSPVPCQELYGKWYVDGTGSGLSSG